MAKLYYRVLRGVAIILGLGLTSYSAWLSWSHHGDLAGPVAAVTGAALFVFAECAALDRRWIKTGLLFGLGILALVISGMTAYQRVASSQETRLLAARSDNLPKLAAAQALADEKAALATAEQEAIAECRSGRRAKCDGAEQREKAARTRVDEARTKLAGLGAQRSEDPGAAGLATLIPWLTAEQIQRATPALLPLWIELASPLLLSLGFAPSKKVPPKAADKRKRRRRRTRKPPTKKVLARGDNVLPLVRAKSK